MDRTTDLHDLWSTSYDTLDNPMIAMCEHALAHFWHEGQEVPLEAHAHDADEYRRIASDTGLLVSSITEWAPDASAVARSIKLAKRTGQPVLLDLELTPRS